MHCGVGSRGPKVSSPPSNVDRLVLLEQAEDFIEKRGHFALPLGVEMANPTGALCLKRRAPGCV